jgi:hypothetical protein
MPLNDAILNTGVTAMQTAITHLSIHTALPNASGSNESTAPRVATGWGAAANGDFATLTNKAFTGGAANGPALYVGFWNGATLGSGTFYGYQALTGDAAFNSAGEYTITSLAITGTAT